MKYVYGTLALLTVVFAVDLGVAHLQDWLNRRRRKKAAIKYGMLPGAFKGTKQHDWWLS